MCLRNKRYHGTFLMNRIIYIDYLKALGIVLVILYHCQYVPFDSLMIRGIYATCVPVFFLVNGYLMLKREYSFKELLIKNCRLLIVMFFWAFVSTVVYMWTSGALASNGLVKTGGRLFAAHGSLPSRSVITYGS